MSKAKAPKPIKPIDTNMLMQLQRQNNQINTSTPFGSQTYGTGPDGQRTFTTQIDPQLQQVINRGMGLAQRDLQRYEPPKGWDELVSMYMGRALNGRSQAKGGG